ncbi:hypothetical protein CBR_g40830 [Chara braunii]|uniref:Uncharacterized protein n=1 Tax=Chara braunii TaxID=69332 RepID=A0A388LUL5_CHABU|nr:hypothetical protein CBR_g40830 [Chara braunii]|eukprot:GBG86016.1 hypothetical protein CBR_g40830 [Chara braunii]
MFGDFTAREKKMTLDLILAGKVVVTTGRTFAKKLMNMNDLYTEVCRERYMVRMFNYVLFKSERRGQREWNDDFFIRYDDIMKRFELHGLTKEIWEKKKMKLPVERTNNVPKRLGGVDEGKLGQGNVGYKRYHDAKIGAIKIFLARCEDLWFNRKMRRINTRIYNEALEPEDCFDIMDSEEDTDDGEIDLPLPDARNHAADKNMRIGSLSGGDPVVVEVGGPTMASCKTAQLTHTQTSSAGDGTEASTSKWKDKRGAPGFPTLMRQMFDHIMEMPTENQTRGQHDDSEPEEDDMCLEDNPLFHIPDDEDKDLTPGDEIESMSSHGGRSGGEHDAGDALVFGGASPRDTTKPLADNRDEGDKLLHMVCTGSGSQIAPDSMEREEGGGMEGVRMTHGREAGNDDEEADGDANLEHNMDVDNEDGLGKEASCRGRSGSSSSNVINLIEQSVHKTVILVRVVRDGPATLKDRMDVAIVGAMAVLSAKLVGHRVVDGGNRDGCELDLIMVTAPG